MVYSSGIAATVVCRHPRPRGCAATTAGRGWLHTAAVDPVPWQEGDSARSLRSRRNGARRRAREGKKKGGGEKRAVASNATYAALLFPFFTPCAEHHSAKRGSVERNLQRSTTSLHKTACFQPYGSNFFSRVRQYFLYLCRTNHPVWFGVIKIENNELINRVP